MILLLSPFPGTSCYVMLCAFLLQYVSCSRIDYYLFNSNINLSCCDILHYSPGRIRNSSAQTCDRATHQPGNPSLCPGWSKVHFPKCQAAWPLTDQILFGHLWPDLFFVLSYFSVLTDTAATMVAYIKYTFFSLVIISCKRTKK